MRGHCGNHPNTNEERTMYFTLKSRKYGAQEFRAAQSEGFVYLWHANYGTWKQACSGGDYTGSTVMLRGNQDALKEAARRWWRQRQRNTPYC